MLQEDTTKFYFEQKPVPTLKSHSTFVTRVMHFIHVVCYLTLNGQTRQTALSNGTSDQIISTRRSSQYTGVRNLNLSQDFDFRFFFATGDNKLAQSIFNLDFQEVKNRHTFKINTRGKKSLHFILSLHGSCQGSFIGQEACNDREIWCSFFPLQFNLIEEYFTEKCRSTLNYRQMQAYYVIKLLYSGT